MWVVTPFLIAVPTSFYLRALDRFEKKPARYIVAAFLWGAVPVVFLAILSQMTLGLPIKALLSEKSLDAKLIRAGFFAPITEEALMSGAVARHSAEGVA